MLFTIFINDLPAGLSCRCKIFADVTKLYDSANNYANLQKDLLILEKWSDKWKLHFNMDKCKVMHIGKLNPKFDYPMLKNKKDIIIKKCTYEKDLGVTFDDNLQFDAHVQRVINKANSMIGIISRTFTYLNKRILVNLNKTLVRPHLEFGNEIWFPTLKRQSAAIEKVQRRATQILNELKHISYDECMKNLTLPSLKYRRLRGDMILIYKLMNGLVDIDWHCFFTLTKTKIIRCSKHKLFIKYSTTSIRKNTFSNRSVPVWNALNDNTALSLNHFKNLLDKDPKFKTYMYEYDE